ncbi:unnamed protein product [Symbiodinium sp. CCMP2456]|nr:unnamed protein product [Symbiodinium sp. CCMP2456]
MQDIDEGRRLLMASHDAETISCSGASGHSRDMQKELDEWRQQRARQGKAKESTLERSFTAITPKKMQRRIPLSPRCSVDSSSITVQERDMRKELQSWKEARARQSRGKENLFSQPFRGLKSQRPRATDMRRASSPASPTDQGCLMGSPGVCLGGSAVAAAIATLEPPLLLAPPPSPTARTGSNCPGLRDRTLQPSVLHAAVLAAFSVGPSEVPEEFASQSSIQNCASSTTAGASGAKEVDCKGAQTTFVTQTQIGEDKGMGCKEEEEVLHQQHLALLDRLAELQQQALRIQEDTHGAEGEAEQVLRARFEQVAMDLQELNGRQRRQEMVSWRHRVRRHVISWPAQTALDMEDHLSRAHDLFTFWFFEMRERIKTLLDSKVSQKPVSLPPIYED